MISKVICALALITLVCIAPLCVHSSAASPEEFSSATSAINSAFASTNNAAQSGGNVSSLIAELNSALALVQRAQSENASNPSQASADLSSATQIAQQVSTKAPSIGQSGSSARLILMGESVGGIIVIAILGILAYIYGGRIYRLLWLYAYRNYGVKRGNE